MTHDLDRIPAPGNPDPSDRLARLQALRALSVQIGKLLADGRAASAGFPLLANHYEALVYRQMAAVGQIDEMLRELQGGEE